MDLRPDLVLANLEENDAQDVMALEIAGIPCWVCDVRSVERAFALLADLGHLVGCGPEGEKMGPRCEGAVDTGTGVIFSTFQKGSLCGLAFSLDVGGFGCLHTGRLRWWGWSPWPDLPRYPECSMEDVVSSGVEGVLLPSEPFPFKESHLEECAGLPAQLVDGEMFSWYGSRMMQVAFYFASTDF